MVVGGCHMTFALRAFHSEDHIIIITFFLNPSSADRGIYWKGTLKKTWNGNSEFGNLEWEPWMGTLNENLVKNFQTQWGRLERKTERPLRISQPRIEADESQRVMSLVKNLLIQWWEDWGGKLSKEINWWKTSRTWWGNVREKPKDYRYYQYKNFPT